MQVSVLMQFCLLHIVLPASSDVSRVRAQASSVVAFVLLYCLFHSSIVLASLDCQAASPLNGRKVPHRFRTASLELVLPALHHYRSCRLCTACFIAGQGV